jgi:hypothetical protein
MRDEFWRRHADLVGMAIALLDFREAGWSEERARAFLADHFGGRDTVELGDLRPFVDDVMVQDVFRYRRLRREAAARFEAIRHTWVNVEHEERAGHLPETLAPLITVQERQSGRLVRAGDLLPFVGRPLVWNLLERKLADCGVGVAQR